MAQSLQNEKQIRNFAVAAGDLSRAVAAIGIAGAENVEAQTVHAFCFSMLAHRDVLQATGHVPRPLLQSEERK